MKLLEIKNLQVSFDHIQVLSDIDISIEAGTITALMGPNGSGKSTILKALFGLVEYQNGTFIWNNESFHPDIDGSLLKGISYVPQGRQLFMSLTVLENIEIGGFVLKNKILLQERINSVLELFPMLRQKLHTKAQDLSGGQQQMVAIARGLVTDPKLLLLDEPTLGLAPKVVKEVFEVIDTIRDERGIAVLVVEHNLKSLLKHVDQGYILKDGVIAYYGNGEDLQDLEAVEKLLLS